MRTATYGPMLLAVALVLANTHGGVSAEESGIPRTHHPWGGCPTGAWKTVRVTTESLDEQGRVTQSSITETTTTVSEHDNIGVTLEIRSIVELAGKRFDSDPQVIRQGYQGELADQQWKITSLGTGTVSIEDQKFPVKIEQLESIQAAGKATTTLYYSDTVAPFVLKRRTVLTDADNQNTLGESTVDVIALDMPAEVLGELRSVAHVRTVNVNPKGHVSTLAFVAPGIPGGVVSHTSKEVDKTGRITRRSVLNLVAYSLEPEEDHGTMFGRKRGRGRRSYSPDN